MQVSPGRYDPNYTSFTSASVMEGEYVLELR